MTKASRKFSTDAVKVVWEPETYNGDLKGFDWQDNPIFHIKTIPYVNKEDNSLFADQYQGMERVIKND